MRYFVEALVYSVFDLLGLAFSVVVSAVFVDALHFDARIFPILVVLILYLDIKTDLRKARKK